MLSAVAQLRLPGNGLSHPQQLQQPRVGRAPTSVPPDLPGPAQTCQDVAAPPE